ncbi:hypothetical protein L6R29_22515, partial [Myxococcota bacterium]|nr:hypothetical protein [Myxococcota bacterium]
MTSLSIAARWFRWGAVLCGTLLMAGFLIQCAAPECASDVDCTGTKICDVKAGKCIENTSAKVTCSKDSDCASAGAGARCLRSTCVLLPGGYEFPEAFFEPAIEAGPEPEP